MTGNKTMVRPGTHAGRGTDGTSLEVDPWS